MQARFYAPWFGRFLSPDPGLDQHFEFTQKWNIYSYVSNNPTMKFDPDGKQEKEFYQEMRKQGYWDKSASMPAETTGEKVIQAVTVGGLGIVAAPGVVLAGEGLGVGEATAATGRWALGQGRAIAGGLAAAGSWLMDKAGQAKDAVSNLLSKAGNQVQTFADRAEARGAFSEKLGEAANRFFRGATSKSVDFKAIDLKDGAKQLQFFSPANNPGYGKLYVQVVDTAGKVIKEYKDTMGPKGLIERKWITGGP